MIHPLLRCVRRALLVAAVPVLLLLPAGPASAASPSANLSCTIAFTNTIHPGLTPQRHHQSGTTHGLTGTATCTGTVNGQPVTGPGSYKELTQGFGDCTQASANSNFVLKIPTASGTRTVTGKFTITVTGGVVVLTGDLTGTSVFVPLEGDCVTTPLKSVAAVHTAQVVT